MKDKTIVITGSYPPDVCGVGDYVASLKSASNAQNWEVFTQSNWKIKNFFRYVKMINNMKPDKVIIQYPTQGYGWSFLPFMLMIYYSAQKKNKCIVTYHEFSNQSVKARLCEDLALYGVKKLVVTNEYEKEAVKKHHKNLDVSVIKIFSNIPKVNKIKELQSREYFYCYFGQIRPNKGIEQFIELVKDLDQKKILIGTIPKEFGEYGEKIIEYAKENNIAVKNDASLSEVAELLNNCKAVILPFVDGISERRGSFLAAAVNGCLICSTTGRYTTEVLQQCLYINLPSSSDYIRKCVLETTNEQWKNYTDKVNKYLKENIPDSWEQVVEQYNNL